MRRFMQVSYIAAAGVLAALGGIRQDAHYYLAAFVLTLPVGIAAIVAVYGGYALIAGVGGLFASRTDAGGDQAGWLAVSSGTFDVLVLAAAALVNVLLLERWRAARSARAARPEAPVPPNASAPPAS